MRGWMCSQGDLCLGQADWVSGCPMSHVPCEIEMKGLGACHMWGSIAVECRSGAWNLDQLNMERMPFLLLAVTVSGKAKQILDKVDSQPRQKGSIGNPRRSGIGPRLRGAAGLFLADQLMYGGETLPQYSDVWEAKPLRVNPLVLSPFGLARLPTCAQC